MADKLDMSAQGSIPGGYVVNNRKNISQNNQDEKG